MSFQSGQIDRLAVESSGGVPTAIVVECSMTDDRASEPWRGQYRFEGDELAALPSDPTQRKAAIRTRILQHLRRLYPLWVESFTPPTAQDIATTGIAPFTAQEVS